MDPGAHANCIGGEWQAAQRGATFQTAAGADAWPQSGAEDVALAWRAARAGASVWARERPAERERRLQALADALERDGSACAALAARCELPAAELAPHCAGLGAAAGAALARPAAESPGVSWCAPDWRELLRAPLLDVLRELDAGRAVVLVSDARAPELAAGLARAAVAAGLPPGVLGLLHGATRELVALAIAGAEPGEGRLLASGATERMGELRRACERSALADVRLRALRCRAHEVDPRRSLADSVRDVIEGAFGRGATLSGQLAGTLGRVHCPARSFSAFSERLLTELADSHAVRTPVAQIDDEAAARVRAAWELGLDEGATCIFGAEGVSNGRVLEPTVFTNVEAHMQSARRQEPLPVLCLLRSS